VLRVYVYIPAPSFPTPADDSLPAARSASVIVFWTARTPDNDKLIRSSTFARGVFPIPRYRYTYHAFDIMPKADIYHVILFRPLLRVFIITGTVYVSLLSRYLRPAVPRRLSILNTRYVDDYYCSNYNVFRRWFQFLDVKSLCIQTVRS